MTTTTRNTEHDMTPLFRTEIKRNGIVIRTIHSDSGHDYHVTLFEGRVSSCEQANGEPCHGWRYRHSCHHATLALQLEQERQSERDADRTAYNNYCLSMNI